MKIPYLLLKELAFCAVSLAISLNLAALSLPCAAQTSGGKPFKIKIQQDDMRTPTLNRNKDVRQSNDDPFSGKDDDDTAIDAPRNSFEPEVTRPPKPLRATIQTDQNPRANIIPANPIMAPTDMGGDEDPLPQQAQSQGPAQYNPADPDSSPEMQLAWDMWHKRVASSIFDRFNFFAKAAFKFSPPLTAKLSYMVTRDGHINNINLDQKSTNMLFNVLIVQCVKSLDGDLNTLQFPQGSRRMSVPKYGTFAQNWGGANGFRYTVGDKETVAKQQQQQMMQQQAMQQQMMQQQMMQQNARGY